MISAILIFFLVLPTTTLDLPSASGEDIPVPISFEASSRIFIDSDFADKGFTLIAPHNTKNVYLVDDRGDAVHTWTSTNFTTGTVELLKDGTLIRGRSGARGEPDGVHILDMDSTVLWDYQLPSGMYWHHDIEPTPNGTFLLNARVVYNHSQAIELGRYPEITPGTLNVEPILEVRPKGKNGGDIIWKWDPIDHIIQNNNPDMPNYGIIAEHPELIDINYQKVFTEAWQHSNSVSYNPDLDQIMITNRNFDELWIIDHNTTTEEAAGHSGGAHGKGGDILYRWGNTEAYRSGNASDHILYGPHDAHWVRPGLPGEGNIIVFNNGENFFVTSPQGKISSVEELVPPVNASGGYDLTSSSVYGPSGPVWHYNASPPESFYAWAMGGLERLPNGNTLICGGSTGYVFEVDPDGVLVWDYTTSGLFKASRYFPPTLKKVQDIMATEDVMMRVNVSSLISDVDTDHEDLEIGVDSPYVTVSGHELMLQYPDGVTTDIINLTVSDGIFEVGRNVRVDITPVNDPPTLLPIPNVSVIEDVPYILDLRSYIWDPDTSIDQMTITEDSPFVTIMKGELRFLYPNGVLSDNTTLLVSDGEFENRTEIFINVTPVNDPPTVDPIPDQEGVEDVPWTIDLQGHIQDVDNPISDISMVTTSRYASVSGLTITVQYPEGVTQDVVRLAVRDGEADTSVEFNVTIEPVNDPPEIGEVPSMNVTEDEPSSLDVGPFISDIDTPLEELVISVDSPFVAVEEHVLALLYPDGVFLDEVVLEISDGEFHASTTLVVNVVPVNDPPVVGGITPLTIGEDEPFRMDIGPSISDVDTPREELTVLVDSPFVDVEGHVLILLYPEGVHRDEVIVEVWDGEFKASTTLIVNVKEVNDPPWWTDLPDLSATEDTGCEFDLVPFIGDIDTPLRELVVEVDSSYCRVEGHTLKCIYPEGVLGEQVTLVLTDGEFRVHAMMNFTVLPVNDAPELLDAGVDPPEGVAGSSFTFSVVFRDVDMGPTSPAVQVVVDGTDHLCIRDETDTGSYGEGVMFLLEMELGPGNHTFHFHAEDGNGGEITSGPLWLVVQDMPEEKDRDDRPGFVMLALIVFASVLVLVLLALWRRGSWVNRD